MVQRSEARFGKKRREVISQLERDAGRRALAKLEALDGYSKTGGLSRPLEFLAGFARIHHCSEMVDVEVVAAQGWLREELPDLSEHELESYRRCIVHADRIQLGLDPDRARAELVRWARALAVGRERLVLDQALGVVTEAEIGRVKLAGQIGVEAEAAEALTRLERRTGRPYSVCIIESMASELDTVVDSLAVLREDGNGDFPAWLERKRPTIYTWPARPGGDRLAAWSRDAQAGFAASC